MSFTILEQMMAPAVKYNIAEERVYRIVNVVKAVTTRFVYRKRTGETRLGDDAEMIRRSLPQGEIGQDYGMNLA